MAGWAILGLSDLARVLDFGAVVGLVVAWLLPEALGAPSGRNACKATAPVATRATTDAAATIGTQNSRLDGLPSNCAKVTSW
ncbi:hypothetical protein [Flindersiella endophytica]